MDLRILLFLYLTLTSDEELFQIPRLALCKFGDPHDSASANPLGWANDAQRGDLHRSTIRAGHLGPVLGGLHDSSESEHWNLHETDGHAHDCRWNYR